jgi:hypothetical protein
MAFAHNCPMTDFEGFNALFQMLKAKNGEDMLNKFFKPGHGKNHATKGAFITVAFINIFMNKVMTISNT